jgi:hypothetical protein
VSKRRSISGVELVVVVAMTFVAAIPLLLPGFLDTFSFGDSPFVLLRLIELDQGVQAGDLFPRWAADFAYGYGYPFFNYYAPLAYYVAEAFHLVGFGFIGAAKAAFLVGFLCSGVGMYLFARDVFDELIAVLVSVAYVFAPFHLVNVYLRGDALGEFFAYGLFPIVLWSFRRLAQTRAPRYLALSIAAYGALAFTHNISALLFSALLAAYVVFLALTTRFMGGRAPAGDKPSRDVLADDGSSRGEPLSLWERVGARAQAIADGFPSVTALDRKSVV